MAHVILLGTAAAFSLDARETTMLAICGPRSTVLVDCGGNAVRRMQQAGIALDTLERLILTHTHPDHTAGFPLLVEMLWLAGRRRPLPVHGPPDTLDLARRVFAQWNTSGWEGLFDLEWQAVPLEQGAQVASGADFDILAAPGIHSVPVIGLRATERATGRVLAYGADGEPSDGVRWLARGAHLLVHEATGDYKGHSTVRAAADVAAYARAGRLALVHLARPHWEVLAEITAAHDAYNGEIVAGRDLDVLEI